MMIKEGLEVIACWFLHGYLFSLCVAEPVMCEGKEVKLGFLASSVEASLFYKKSEQPLFGARS